MEFLGKKVNKQWHVSLWILLLIGLESLKLIEYLTLSPGKDIIKYKCNINTERCNASDNVEEEFTTWWASDIQSIIIFVQMGFIVILILKLIYIISTKDRHEHDAMIGAFNVKGRSTIPLMKFHSIRFMIIGTISSALLLGMGWFSYERMYCENLRYCGFYDLLSNDLTYCGESYAAADSDIASIKVTDWNSPQVQCHLCVPNFNTTIGQMCTAEEKTLSTPTWQLFIVLHNGLIIILFFIRLVTITSEKCWPKEQVRRKNDKVQAPIGFGDDFNEI